MGNLFVLLTDISCYINVASNPAPAPASPAPIMIAATLAQPAVPTVLAEPFETLSPGRRIGVLYNRLRAEGDSAKLLNDLGLAYMEVGDTWGAVEMFDRGRAIAPNDADLAYNLMLAQLQGNDMNAARKQMSDYLRLETDPDDAARVRNTPRFKDLLPE